MDSYTRQEGVLESTPSPISVKRSREFLAKYSRLHFFRRLLLCLALVSAVFAALFYHTLSLLAEVDSTDTDTRLNTLIEVVEYSVVQDFEDLTEDLFFLAERSSQSGYFQQGAAAQARGQLQDLFVSKAKAHPDFDQVRLLSLQGEELIRVNLDQGQVLAVAPHELQNKQRRSYFLEMQKLVPDQVYVSDLSLNVEQGVVELPHKPMIRFATLVHQQGKPLGYLVINLNAQHLLTQIRTHFHHSQAQGLLVESSKAWLLRESGEFVQDDWPFRADPVRYGPVWNTISSTPSGTIEIDDLRLVYGTISPFNQMLASGVDMVIGQSEWKVIFKRSREQLSWAYVLSKPAYVGMFVILYPLSLILVVGVCSQESSRRLAERRVLEFSQSLEKQVMRRHHELIATQDAAMASLASLAETRDNETGQHIYRTQSYVRVLVYDLLHHSKYQEQLTPELAKLIVKSAPLHDVGKIGLPDSILLKPGSLSLDEYEQMKQHTTIGAKAIQHAIDSLSAQTGIDGAATFLGIAKEVAQSHHEHWDGSGYPEGLSGEAIPLAARIMAVADVYDALVSSRVYKPTFGKQFAEKIMLEESQGHFDPEVLAAFKRHKEAFWNIAQRHGDPQISNIPQMSLTA
ncbi:HD-GYP domain-containing protein [Ferrimonas aestuarii]|uniref:HD domain-containing protein n=1 Tax=Ferrimonas aestuarii TaxID=2569539 RepID=A0A4U1BHB2_9GAMM|nr:HD domain-containing phosphohydrolase [Ferrimonas aestuarii]TKB50770.1 HD domain-containing protein [Ferrimonas aestuarii]